MNGKVTIGILFILFGLVTLLQQFNIFYFGNIFSTWWPIIIIAVGINKLTSKNESKTSGVIFLVVGAFLQLKTLNIITVSIWRIIWPAIFIFIGFNMLLSKEKYVKDFHGNSVNDDVVDYVNIFSALENRNFSQNFKGGSIVAVFGGVTIDLRDAELAPEGAILDMTTAFGGIELIVPTHWKVIVTGVPIFGGWSNKTQSDQLGNNDDFLSVQPVLRVKCVAAFGGIDIKNHNEK
ncbi:LiaF transmembrane domain-containing protein [uncultured Clostridium sp.]|uniref:LiaF transmembrane domain-containing protein n=1 Tax=uncultured Clostridium sp. TaxID=59620 RepID=UPI0028F03992|nr:DUF5668 domain-containing protein [uncultured Clostridium sp.]